MRKYRFLQFLSAAFCLLPAFALAAPKQIQSAAPDSVLAAKAFGAARTPTTGAAEPIGFYSKGCLAGAQAMPLDTPRWQMLHPQRRRYYGHPIMISYLQNLAQAAAAVGWRGLLIGDIAQPRGGPLLSGHASHQTGLDADIWLTPMPAGGMPLAARQNMSGGTVLKTNSLELDPKKWSAAHTALLKLAAEDPQTDRIFVHPGIKKYLCDSAGADNEWLAKLRPYWGHFEHFHVRLKCPPEAKTCRTQAPAPKGSGCDSSLEWWFTKEAWETKKPKTVKKRGRRPKALTIADLPKPCKAVLRPAAAKAQAK